MRTFCAITPQAVTSAPADSLRRAEWKAKQAALRKKLQADEAEAGMSHADSVFIRPSQDSFEAICVPTNDLGAVVSPSAYQTQYLKAVAKADSLSLRSASTTTQETAATTYMEPTPRGHAPLSDYAGAAVVSFFAMVIVLSIVRIASRTFLGDLFGFFTGSIGWKRLETSQFVQMNLSFTLVNAIYALMLAVLAVEVALVFSPGPVEAFGAYRAAGIAALAIVAYYMGRRTTDAVLSYAFRIEERMRSVILYHRAACGIIGLLLAPCALIMPFVSYGGCLFLIGVACFVIIAVTLLCLGKLMRINMTSLPTILYFILYLCIVEAAPLVCLAKLAMLAVPLDLHTIINQ